MDARIKVLKNPRKVGILSLIAQCKQRRRFEGLNVDTWEVRGLLLAQDNICDLYFWDADFGMHGEVEDYLNLPDSIDATSFYTVTSFYIAPFFRDPQYMYVTKSYTVRQHLPWADELNIYGYQTLEYLQKNDELRNIRENAA